MHFLHAQCLRLQLRMQAAAPPQGLAGTMPAPKRRKIVRFVELATSGLTAVVAQILIVATIFI
jgi:hypothetical protein